MNLPGLPHSPLPAFIPASIPAFIPAFRPARLRGFIPPHLTSLLLAWLFALAGALAEPATAWDWPLASPHPIVAPYAAPATPYAAGHRGLDLEARQNDPVLAPADGVVVFVGVVVDRPVLTLRHDGDLVSSYEPVAALVLVGDRVAAGQWIGRVASGGHCDTCVHFGVRLRGEYVSPLLLLGGIARAVLLPVPGSGVLSRGP